MKKPIRIGVFSDDHCGHLVGFTPPAWDRDKAPIEPEWKEKSWHLRRAVYNWQESLLDSMPAFDIVISNGDCVDGKGDKSGGIEQLEQDEQDQVEMAAQVLKWRAEREGKKARIFMSFGTPYHVGQKTDWERAVAHQCGAEKIDEIDNLDIRGVILNYRHHVGRSIIPHGRFTALAREKLWNDLWALRGEYPAAQVVIRSHVHYHVYCGTPEWLALTTPANQGYGSKFGMRFVTGTVDVGFVTMEIYGPGEIDWRAHIWRHPLKEAYKIAELETMENADDGNTP